MLIDSHTHIQFAAYDKDREAVIKRARAAGVKMVCVGTQAATSETAIKLAEQYPDDVWAVVGFHPGHLGEKWHHDWKEQTGVTQEQFDIEKLKKLAISPKVVAIGECGLDYYRIGNDALPAGRQESGIKERQREVFVQQANLAVELKKALMIHCRPSKETDDAYDDLLSIIHDSLFTIPKIVHFYTGSLDVTKKFLDAGCYFTFGGVITFARDYDEIIKYIPLDRILPETDAPYVAPAPYRGKRNEPAYIIEVVKKLAEIKNVSLESATRTTVLGTHIWRID